MGYQTVLFYILTNKTREKIILELQSTLCWYINKKPNIWNLDTNSLFRELSNNLKRCIWNLFRYVVFFIFLRLKLMTQKLKLPWYQSFLCVAFKAKLFGTYSKQAKRLFYVYTQWNKQRKTISGTLRNYRLYFILLPRLPKLPGLFE